MQKGNQKRRPLAVEELENRLVPATVFSDISSNWGGYAVTTKPGAVSGVAGTWVVPAVSGDGTATSSVWVGIDGYHSPTVEQIGTDSDMTNGTPQYFAWFEMYPRDMVQLRMAIHPGDTISARVLYLAHSSQFRLTLTDVTTRKTFSTLQQALTARRSSAEWIVEAPEVDGQTSPLANFGSVTISGAQATIGGVTSAIDTSPKSGLAVYQIDLAQGGETTATSSALTDSGSPVSSSFTTTYVSPSGFLSFLPPRWWPYRWFHGRRSASPARGSFDGSPSVASNLPGSSR
jgi:hypothetical protein